MAGDADFMIGIKELSPEYGNIEAASVVCGLLLALHASAGLFSMNRRRVRAINVYARINVLLAVVLFVCALVCFGKTSNVDNVAQRIAPKSVSDTDAWCGVDL